MKLSSSLLLLSSAIAVASAADDYECVGTFIFGRHNDRNVKPANILSPIGAQHQYDMGSFFRERYFGLTNSGKNVSSDYKIDGLNPYGLYDLDDFYGEAISANVILFSHLSFLQGLYPPTTITTSNEKLADEVFAELSNGTEVLGPLGGYQYVQSYIQEPKTPDYIWIKGDGDCPASDDALYAYFNSTEFKQQNESTLAFYKSLRSILPTADWPDHKLNFYQAMNIYDYMNVNYIHNETLASKWNETILNKVKLLSDQYNFKSNYNTSNKLSNLTIGGQTLAGAILTQLNTTKTEGSPYINYYTGSFNTYFQFFGLSDLYKVSENFTGMPDYGSALVFELMKQNDDYFVQFSFKNGSTSPIELTTYPLFNSNQTMLPWNDFVNNMKKISITSLETWCDACSATVDMCAAKSQLYEDAKIVQEHGVNLAALAGGDYSSVSKIFHKSKLTNADAGGIGAGVTIGVGLILAALYFLVRRRRGSSEKAITETLPVAEKRVSHTSSSDNTI